MSTRLCDYAMLYIYTVYTMLNVTHYKSFLGIHSIKIV